MAVGVGFLNVHLCAYGKVGREYDVAVFVAVSGFDKCILGDYLAVSGSHILGCIHSELYIGNLTVSTDTEDFIGGIDQQGIVSGDVCIGNGGILGSTVADAVITTLPVTEVMVICLFCSL